MLQYIAQEVKAVHSLGVQVSVVVGGGNFIRGSAFSSNRGIDRTVADHLAGKEAPFMSVSDTLGQAKTVDILKFSSEA